MWFGYENAVPTPEMSPEEFAPTSQHSLHWPKWGQHFETSGQAGEPVDMDKAKELLALYRAWRNVESRAEQERIWHRMLEIHADQVYTIGLVAQIPQPIVVSNKLRNVPKEGIFNWDPGAQFGIYRPDSFWFAE
jgi:peptide/nickel transport system substrate-binding protein